MTHTLTQELFFQLSAFKVILKVINMIIETVNTNALPIQYDSSIFKVITTSVAHQNSGGYLSFKIIISSFVG